ncbi:MAG: hypothetical protein K9J30_07635 [Bacteroidales bacterium]|nr:hypothetical protein [Bacteroidales bacterium]
MFTVGLFSTHLPYILIAMFYGAYIGFHTIMKAGADDDVNDRLIAKNIKLTDASDEKIQKHNTFHYFNYSAEPAANREFRVQSLLSRFKVPIIECLIPRAPFLNCLYSRPPPSA